MHRRPPAKASLIFRTRLVFYQKNEPPQWSPHHEPARRFFEEETIGRTRFFLCGLVLVELYMQLRNPAVFKKPKTAREATAFCDALHSNPAWEFGDYEPDVAKPLWNWTSKTKTGFRAIIDARLAFTLRYHGVTHFATANTKHFDGFGFEKVWNPLKQR